MSVVAFVTIALLSVAAVSFGAGFVYGAIYERDQRRDYDRRTMQGLRRIGRAR